MNDHNWQNALVDEVTKLRAENERLRKDVTTPPELEPGQRLQIQGGNIRVRSLSDWHAFMRVLSEEFGDTGLIADCHVFPMGDADPVIENRVVTTWEDVAKETQGPTAASDAAQG